MQYHISTPVIVRAYRSRRREHSLYIPRALCGAPKVRLLVSRGAGRSIVCAALGTSQSAVNSSTVRVSDVGVDQGHLTQPNWQFLLLLEKVLTYYDQRRRCY